MSFHQNEHFLKSVFDHLLVVEEPSFTPNKIFMLVRSAVTMDPPMSDEEVFAVYAKTEDRENQAASLAYLSKLRGASPTWVRKEALELFKSEEKSLAKLFAGAALFNLQEEVGVNWYSHLIHLSRTDSNWVASLDIRWRVAFDDTLFVTDPE